MLGTVLVALSLFAGHEFLPTALGSQELSKMCVNKASGRVRFVTSTATCNTKTETAATLPGTGPVNLCAANSDGMVRKVALPTSCTGTETAITAPQTGPTFFCYKPTTGSFLRLVAGAGSSAADEWVAVISVPVAVDDTRSVNEDGSLTALTVLGNDTDALLDPMTATLVAASGPSNAASFTFNANGTFSYTPAADYFGPDSFQYTATDGTYTSTAATVSITVNPVNDAPTFSLAGNQSVPVDSGPQTVSGFATGITAGPANESAQTLTFFTTTDNPTLFSALPSVSAAGTLTYQSTTGVTGSANITVSLKDSGGVLNGGVDTTQHTFTITINPPGPNGPPVNAMPGPKTMTQDTVLTLSGAGAISISDPDAGSNPVQVALTATNGKMTLSGTGGLSFTVGDGTDDAAMTFTGTISAINAALNGMTYTPTAGHTGAASIAITTDDQGFSGSGGAMTDSDTLPITVNAVNQPPTFTAGGNQTVLEDAGPQTVVGWATAISPGTGESGQTPFTFNVSNNNNPLFSAQPVIASNGTLTYTPAANANGSATVTVTLTDSGVPPATSTPAVTFTITVTSVNDPPTFTPGGNQTVAEDAGAQTVTTWASAISPGPGETGQTPLTFNVSNNNNALFSSQPAVSSSTGNLTYTPAANAFGTATVTVTLTDSGVPPATSTPAVTFTITVAAVNDPPTFTAGGNQTVLEDAGLQTVVGWATAISPGPGESGQTPFTFNVSNNNNPLFSAQPAIASNGTLTYTPAANASGSATVSVTLTDSGVPPATSSPAQTFTISVTPVNDPPTFTLAGNQTVAEDAGAQSVAGFAGSISAGPGETGQTPFTFNVTNNNNPLFSAQPAIASNGTLTYTPAANANGVATVSVTLTDSGVPPATSSPALTFTITVTAVNDGPTNTVPGAQTVNEDTDLTFTGANAISIADIDAGASAVKVSLDATSGTVTLPSVAGLTFVDATANGGASVHVTGTVAAINTALNGVKFKGTLNYNSTRTPAATLAITTNDQGNTGTPGALSDADTIAITVNAVNDPPVAQPFAFTVQSNMKRTGLSNLLTGATDPDTGDAGYTFTPTVQSGSFSVTSPAGGTISNVNLSAGSFDFDPPPGATGAVTFTFKICDAGNPGPAQCSANATATATVSGPVIWFVDPVVAGPGDGRLSNPFKQLSSAAAVDAAGHRIFVYSGTVNTGIVLNTNEWLIGQGLVTGSSFDSFFSISPPANTIARPTFNGTRPVVQGNVDMDTNNQVRGLNIQVTGSTQGLSASSATGLTVSHVSVSSATGIAVNMTSADGTFAFTQVSSSGASSGLVWNNTSVATGSLTVEGDGSGTQNATGGTIAGSTAPSVRLHNAKDVTLKSLSITPANAAAAHGIYATDLTGSANVIRGVAISGVADNQSSSIEVDNTNQALGSLAISNSRIASSSSGRTQMLVQNMGNQSMTVEVGTTEFTGIFGVAAQFASGQAVGANGTLSVNFHDNHLHDAPAAGASSVNFAGIKGSTLNAIANTNTATNVGKPVASVGVFSVSAQDTATVNAKVNNNTISTINGYDGVNIAAENSATTLKVEVDNNVMTGLNKSGVKLNVNTNAQQTHVTITDNSIGTNAVPIPNGVPGILLQASTTTSSIAKTANVLVARNAVRNTGVNGNGFGEAFQVLLSGSGTFSTTMNLTVDSNSFDNVSGTVHSGYLEAAWSLGAVCLDLTANDSNGQPIDVVKNGQPFVIRNRDSVAANNPLATFVFSPNLASFGTQSGTCPQPTLPPN